MSGDALSRHHCWSSAVTATQSWVRGATPVPRRAASQFSHPQFHCGTPPPAALPRTIARMASPGVRAAERRAIELARVFVEIPIVFGFDVHSDLGAEVDLAKLGPRPGAVIHHHRVVQAMCSSNRR